MNPMGKDHVTALLDAYLAMDADDIGARATAEAAARLADVPGNFKVGLVVCDDLMGGGTNRYHYEFGIRFGADYSRFSGDSPPKLPRWLKDIWLQGTLWSSEAASERAVRKAVLTAASVEAEIIADPPLIDARLLKAPGGYVLTSSPSINNLTAFSPFSHPPASASGPAASLPHLD